MIPKETGKLFALLLAFALAAGASAAPEDAPAGDTWWAFRPVVKPRPPRIEGDDWSRNPIDRFVLRRLAEHGMEPAPRAERQTLVRRLYFDLLGLPPTPGEIDAFLADTRPDAWESLVDALLDDPRHGEHWARHWLDLVRYSESDGWNQDAYRPHIWRYRDYVIRAFNEDRPYPDFVREQLAGDEIPGDDPERLAAVGFLRLGIYEYNQRDARGHWNDIMNEMTDVVGDVFLGLSMSCARCHDHKFDPIPRRDYFRLRSFFEPISWRDDLPAATRAQQAEYRRRLAAWEEATAAIRERIDALLAPYNERKWKSTVDKFPLDIQACFHRPVEERTSREHQMAYLVSRQFLEEGGGPLKAMTKEDEKKYDALKKELAAFDAIRPEPLPALMTATDFRGTISPTVIPGDPRREAIRPGFLSALAAIAAEDEHDDDDGVTAGSSGRRTSLARWIGRPDNPLTTRVIVNRVWQEHFGRGLVSTPSNFGRQGRAPTHPDLLDWLTASFVESGWRLKSLHRLILSSATWRQSAHHPRAAEYPSRDPAGDLLWRAPVRRLSAEQIRDAMLSVSGELIGELGGPGVEAKIPRRALYVKRFRNTPEPMLHAFDCAGGLKSVDRRTTTTTPTQSLLLMNGDYALERARKLAARLRSGNFARPGDLLRRAVRLTWGREPSASELASALAFVTASSPSGGEEAGIDEDRLIDFCHVLLNASEFLYVD